MIMNEESCVLVLEKLKFIKSELIDLRIIAKENKLLNKYLGEAMKIIYASHFIVEKGIDSNEELPKIITIADVKSPANWLEMANHFIEVLPRMLEIREGFAEWARAGSIVSHIHIGVSQYLDCEWTTRLFRLDGCACCGFYNRGGRGDCI